ncbi:MAG: hypothetical protein ABSF53_18365 [Terracidiphilus sp.]
MPGKNANLADSNFAHYFRESLSVVTNKVLTAGRDGNVRLLLYEPPVKLERKSGNALFMAITQSYEIVPFEKEFKAKTTSYTYEPLGQGDQGLETIVEFHWHPGQTTNLKWPHLHVKANGVDGGLGRVHFPTGRFAIEDYLKLLIRDFGVKPRLPYEQWKEILTRNKREFSASASWLYWKPLI